MPAERPGCAAWREEQRRHAAMAGCKGFWRHRYRAVGVPCYGGAR